MNMEPYSEEERKSYLKRVFKFYFAATPVWRSFLTIFYLAFFVYFSAFHSGKLWIAFKFVLYTIFNSASLLTLSYLFWGVIFLIALIVPFSASFYAIFLLFETWQDSWTKGKRILVTFLIIFSVPLIIVLMDKVIRIVVAQDVLRTFVEANNLRVIKR